MSCITLPGFIDIHVHIRQINKELKEDIDSASAAALATGITMILVITDVPQIVDQKNFNALKNLASIQARCDYAIYLCASEGNYDITCQYISEAAGLEMILSDTNDQLVLPDAAIWIKHLLNWPKRSLGPIICHAERHTLAAVILLAHLSDRRIHINHINNRDDIILIRSAKIRGIKVTCDICVHDLFLSSELITYEDQRALWDNLDVIDIFTSAHIAYTQAEKSWYNYFGFPGLETTLPLLLNAVAEGTLTMEDLIKKMHTNPKKIFNLPDQTDTYITVDLNKVWFLPKDTLYSKDEWKPFSGRKVKGKLCKVVLRGKVVFDNNKVLALPGYGKDIRCEWYDIPKCYCQDIIS